MRTELQPDEYAPLTTIARTHPQLKSAVSHRTLARWTSSRGCRGVVLESTIIGGRRMTTLVAVDRFLAALNSTPATVEAPRSPTARNRASELAARELTAAGA